jgi:dipeptide/tripeptide permease
MLTSIIVLCFLQCFILLSVQAHLPQLKPPPCNMASMDGSCEQAKGFKSSIFFVALYLVALGSGCLKPNMIAHGADQFAGGADNSKRLSTYFNSAYFSFCLGELIALTALVWVQTHSGMDVGFGISAAAMAAGLISLVSGAAFYRNKPPQGSIFTPIARVRNLTRVIKTHWSENMYTWYCLFYLANSTHGGYPAS